MRPDLYAPVHKALRSTLFDLSVELARCDYSSPGEVSVALNAARRTLGFLREHHHHEETIVEPMLEADAPDVVRANRAQHVAIDAKLACLDQAIARIERAPAEGRPALGRSLAATYDGFLADYLAHMRHEETVVQDALWARCTDEELGGLHGRIQASIPPARFAEWLEIMLPAMNVDERAHMLGGMKAGAPEPAFRAASDVAARVLGASAWAAVRARAAL